MSQEIHRLAAARKPQVLACKFALLTTFPPFVRELSRSASETPCRHHLALHGWHKVPM